IRRACAIALALAGPSLVSAIAVAAPKTFEQLDNRDFDLAKGDQECTGGTLTFEKAADGHVAITLGPRIHFEYELTKLQAVQIDKNPDTGCEERSETSGTTNEITEHGTSSDCKPGYEDSEFTRTVTLHANDDGTVSYKVVMDWKTPTGPKRATK